MATKKASPKKNTAPKKRKKASPETVEMRINIHKNTMLKEANRIAEEMARKTKSANTLADELIYGDREQTHGRPDLNLTTIAQFWNVYLDRKEASGQGRYVSALDVCLMMDLLKTARLISNPDHRDSLIDKCGYSGLYDRLLKE